MFTIQLNEKISIMAYLWHHSSLLSIILELGSLYSVEIVGCHVLIFLDQIILFIDLVSGLSSWSITKPFKIMYTKLRHSSNDEKYRLIWLVLSSLFGYLVNGNLIFSFKFFGELAFTS